MSSGIFLLDKDGALVEMNQRDYDSEDILQELIANYPNLMAGNLINEEYPRLWILISRELSIPDNKASLGRWSLDHLFLDQDGIPTLVEVKRSSDTRIRREVVGQMLEYAANAVTYWDIEKIRVLFETRCENEGLIPEQVFYESLNLEEGYNEFWANVKTNLEIGKIRMLFIADNIPLELKQIVEFLNEQMNPAEVLALEIKQYVGQSLKTLVPRLFGQTSKTQRRKRKPKAREWDEQSFLQELGDKAGPEEVASVKKILAWAREKNLRLWWGKGAIQGSCYLQLDHKGHTHYSISIWTSNRVEIQFHYLTSRPVYDSEEKRHEIRLRLNQIPGISLGENVITKLPNFPITVLTNENSLKTFLEIWDEYIDKIKES